MRRIKMHNCKSSRSSFVELACDELPAAKSRQLLRELNDCAACREEYEVVRSTVHVSGQALRLGLPAEPSWPAYREQLRSRLVSANENSAAHFSAAAGAPTAFTSRIWGTLTSLASSSVHVPVPAALALMLLLGAGFIVLRSRGQANTAAPTPSVTVETRTIQVPVIQEKLVTRVVYVDRTRKRGVGYSERAAASTAANSMARALPNVSSQTPLSLDDFKPTDQVKLTITRGSYKDEE
jgi:hypothetical protein